MTGKMRCKSYGARGLLALWPMIAVVCAGYAFSAPPRPRYEPSSPAVVAAMLEMAKVGDQDVVYDLGSGDGRIVIAAAQRGAMAVGIEIDPTLVSLSRELAEKSGAGNRIRIVPQDIFDADISPATVVTLYLLPETNLALRPKLLRELKPGSVVVSHSHDMGEWKPDRHRVVEGHDLYLWMIPANVSGVWEWTIAPPGAAAGRYRMTLRQRYGAVTGEAQRDGKPLVVRRAQVAGSQLIAVLEDPAASAGSLTLTARVELDNLRGVADPPGPGEAFPWEARRAAGTQAPLAAIP